MEHGDFLVDLLDSAGDWAGQVLRRHLRKDFHGYHAVSVQQVMSDGRLVLSVIPHRADLPNLYPGRFGVTAVSVRRTGELIEEAAARTCERELNRQADALVLLGEHLAVQPLGNVVRCSVFRLDSDDLDHRCPEVGALTAPPLHELDRLLRHSPERFSPMALDIWQRYRLPNLPDSRKEPAS